ncbi:2,4'-dihydroxyacetophenone dioxygenase family protein [Cupriavidus metallidurans]|uniref:2,4'-dihydroxyacetophenone dioxygenase family protein n=1 Tax=Cupriavidus TaxID=106589 RepID=UPI000E86DD96|nr:MULTISPECIES: 2,4'-dihydroxyacetophenone dioxygenase family protein [Cupriavidus]GMG94373.1 2,4'-dihydroxyacetophenone dioxygenase [Cupriavidus sp. TKC]HBD33547.1 2,4'-dihydroxyacetophenone dioxygenase [Cupriavidus sp.]
MAIPETVTHQDKLLCVDTTAHPFLKAFGGHEGIEIFPLFLDPYNGVWMIRARFAPGLTLPMHFHTGVVHFYTMSGSWYYTEYPNQKQTAGCYLYEPGGSIHQFNTPADNDGPTDVIFLIVGANVNFMPDGSFISLSDAGQIKTWVDQAIRAQDNGMKYISAGIPGYSD